MTSPRRSRGKNAGPHTRSPEAERGTNSSLYRDAKKYQEEVSPSQSVPPVLSHGPAGSLSPVEQGVHRAPVVSLPRASRIPAELRCGHPVEPGLLHIGYTLTGNGDIADWPDGASAFPSHGAEAPISFRIPPLAYALSLSGWALIVVLVFALKELI